MVKQDGERGLSMNGIPIAGLLRARDSEALVLLTNGQVAAIPASHPLFEGAKSLKPISVKGLAVPPE